MAYLKRSAKPSMSGCSAIAISTEHPTGIRPNTLDVQMGAHVCGRIRGNQGQTTIIKLVLDAIFHIPFTAERLWSSQLLVKPF
ncbi:hypothetical protein BK655_12995 [Pseudomonas brassicacearum]|nr:hypothetical protein BK655_12995 [Pseudomonas brassicacearum]